MFNINIEYYSEQKIIELNENYRGCTYGRLFILFIYPDIKPDWRKKQFNISPTQIAIARCRCSCGNEINVKLDDILSEKIDNCGCLDIERKYQNYYIIANRKRHIIKQKVRHENDYYYDENDPSIVVVEFANKKGMYFLTDRIVWEYMKIFTWVLKTGYVVTNIGKYNFKFHDIIKAVPLQSNYMIDHINLCKIDNRYINLRTVTPRGNGLNKDNDEMTGIYSRVRKNGTISWEVAVSLPFLLPNDSNILRRAFSDKQEAIEQNIEWRRKYCNIDLETRITPNLILPNGMLNWKEFRFNWYGPRFNLIWERIGLQVYPVPYNFRDPIYNYSLESDKYKLIKGPYNMENI